MVVRTTSSPRLPAANKSYWIMSTAFMAASLKSSHVRGEYSSTPKQSRPEPIVSDCLRRIIGIVDCRAVPNLARRSAVVGRISRPLGADQRAVPISRSASAPDTIRVISSIRLNRPS